MKAAVQQKRTLKMASMVLALAMVVGSVLMPFSVSAAPVEQMGMPNMSNMQSNGQYHVVRQGETLSGIAMQYGTTVYAVMQANGIMDPNQIYAGQRLLIPSGGSMSSDMSGMSGGAMSSGDMGNSMSGGSMHGDMGGDMGAKEEVKCKAYHIVSYGETALEIAMHYGVSTYSLAKANMMSDANAIQVGQKLCIPAGPPPINPPTTEMPKPDKPKQKPMQPMEPMPEQPMQPMPQQPMQPMPPMEPMPPMPEHPMEPMPPMDGGCEHHRVQQGETLAQIAYYYGTPIYALMKENGIMDPNKIYAGQVLKINCSDMGWMPEPMPMPMPEPMPMQAVHPMPMPEPMPEPMPMPMPKQMPITGQQPQMQGSMPPSHPMPEPMPMPEQRPMPMPMPEQMPMEGHGMMPQQPMSGYMEASHGMSMPMPEHKGMSLRPQETWRGSYFCTKDLSGDPVIVRDDYDVRFNWYGNSPGEGLPEDRFSVRWERNVYFDGSTYHFSATVDDGVRVYVGDKLVIDAWHEQPATTYTADVQPPAGVHKVVVEYYEEANMASVDVQWEKSMAMHHW